MAALSFKSQQDVFSLESTTTDDKCTLDKGYKGRKNETDAETFSVNLSDSFGLRVPIADVFSLGSFVVYNVFFIRISLYQSHKFHN